MIEFWLEGWPPSMKNCRRIVTNPTTRKPMIIKSDQAKMWMEYAALQIPAELRGLNLGSADAPLSVTLHVWYENRRPDLDCAIVYDLLEQVGVISNDRHVYEKHEYKHFADADHRPGVMVQICTAYKNKKGVTDVIQGAK
jgi:Holliday junction resolvase RusA-like endonuclease